MSSTPFFFRSRSVLRGALVFRRILPALIGGLFFSLALQAGAVTTAGSGNWNSIVANAPWPGGTVPAAGDDVIIDTSHSVTVTAVVGNSPNSLTLNSGGQIVLNQAITINGATVINGTLAINSASGAKTFSGNVTINNGGTWSATAASAVTVGGNLQNDGTLTAGTGVYTFTGAVKTLSGTQEVVIPSMTINGTYQNNGTVTVATALSGSGTLTQGANAILNIGAGSALTVLNASAEGNSVSYTGGAQTVKSAPYYHLNLSGSGAKSMAGVTNVLGNFSIGGTATATPVITNIAGNLTVTNTAALTTGANLVLGGDLRIASGSILTVGAFTNTVNGRTSVSGILLHNNAIGLKTYAGDVIINSGGAWSGTVATIAYSFGGSLTNNGVIAANTNGVHTFTGVGKFFGGSSPIAISRLTMDGTYQNNGTLIVSNALLGAGVLTQGANATLILVGPTNAAAAVASLVASDQPNTVIYTGGVQTVRAVAYHNLVLAGTGAKDLTGVSTINGDWTVAGSATILSNPVMTIGGAITYSSSGASTLTNTVNAGALVLAGGTLNLGTNLTHTFTGGWTRTAGSLLGGSSTLKIGGGVSGSGGAFTAGTSTVEWNGAGDQTLAVIGYHNLVLSGGGVKSLGSGVSATGGLSVATGVKAGIADGVNVPVGTLTLGGVGCKNGTWGSSLATAAIYHDDVFFTANTGYLTVNADTRPDTLVWRGTGDWFANPGNWSNGIPGPGSNVWIASGTVTLSGATAALGDFAVATNAGVMFTNWTTCLTASNVTIVGGGTLTLPAAFTNNQMSNRVWVVCTNFTLDAGGVILADARGYAPLNGPGLGTTYPARGVASGGGGYGGRGGAGGNRASPGGRSYGAPQGPQAPGSGGGGTLGGNALGGGGGGVVWISASGLVKIDGLVSANGGNGGAIYGDTPCGGGSGGSIYIVGATFGGGTSGVLQANGGNGAIFGTAAAGGGGGGRIAIEYQALSGTPGVRFFANHGNSWTNVDLCAQDNAMAPHVGTLHFSDTRMLDGLIAANNGVAASLFGYPTFQTTTNWAPYLLAVSNSTLGVSAGTVLRITNDLTLTVTGALVVAGGATLACEKNLTLTNQSRLLIYAGETNTVNTNRYGNRVAVSNTLTVASGCWVYPFAHSTNGGVVLLDVGALTVQSGGGINADGRGFARATGPGRGTNAISRYRGSGGGGHGGKGGTGGYDGAVHVGGGRTYDATNVPLLPGSGGGVILSGPFPFGHGGGVVWVASRGAVTLNGAVTANGLVGGFDTSYNDTPSGGGAGGSVFMTCASFAGAGGLLQADGGAGTNYPPTYFSGGGGGGRISVVIGFTAEQLAALWAGEEIPGLTASSTALDFSGTLSVTGGVDAVYRPIVDPPDGSYPGTRQFLKIVAAGQRTVVIAGSPGPYGAPAPNGYGDSWLFDDGTTITNTVSTPASIGDGVRWSCIGWRLTDTALGTLISNDVGTQAVFTAQANVTLTWLWTNQYLLAVSAGKNGSVNSNTVNGWYTNGTGVSGIEATADPGYGFIAWVGASVPAGQAAVNPLTVTLNQARTNLMASFVSLVGETKAWNGVGNWTSQTNWTPEGMPGPNDWAVLQTGTSTLSEAYSVGSLIVSNGATLLFTNWTTCLTASNVTILTNGTMTLPPAFTTNQMSNRVWVVCTNFMLNAGGRILADERGYFCAMGPGSGGSGSGYSSGGGYGGQGGMGLSKYAVGPAYGSTSEPIAPGSGGGVSVGSVYGHGGGAVRIEASGEVTVNGTVSANGRNGGVAGQAGGGGGSGGAIFITCASFGGNTNGLLQANGGKGSTDAGYIQYAYGAGGGGRIAVVYQSLAGTPGVRFSANCGAIAPYPVDINSPTEKTAAQMGTLYFSDSALLDNVLTAWSGTASGMNGYFVFQSTNMWVPGSLLSLNNSTWGILEGFTLQIPNDLTVVTGGLVVATHANLMCDGNLTMSEGARLVVYGGETNAIYTNSYGARVTIANTLTVGSNCWIYPYSHSTNGGSVLLRVGALAIRNGGGIDADGRGYARGTGPGRGTNATVRYQGSGGAGYGGKGGSGSTTIGGGIYGVTNAPLVPGSGGGGVTDGNNRGGHGGGVVWVVAEGSMTIDGTLTANGGPGVLVYGDTPHGAGSGGAINLLCSSFSGDSNGIVRAIGGAGPTNSTAGGGGGGGGRIAVWVGLSDVMQAKYLRRELRLLDQSAEVPRQYLGSFNVTNGTGYTNGAPNGANPGTIYIFMMPNQGTIFSLY